MLHIIITQYALKTGLNKSKERGETSTTKELKQLPALENFAPVDTSKLTKKQRAEAVTPLMFLNGKRNLDIKGCAYADGRKNRDTIKTEDAASSKFVT